MKTKSVEMGAYYQKEPFGLVRTVCRATSYEADDSFIVFVKVGNGGCASEPLLMPEEGFKNIFLA